MSDTIAWGSTDATADATVEMKPKPTPEEETVAKLRAQIKIIEDEKAAAHRKRVFMEEAESLRKQIRSYGLTPVA